MTVAVVITCYRTPLPWLCEAVHSAAAQLAHDDELVIVNDGDPELAERTHISGFPVHHRQHYGIGAASNTGIGLTAAPLIARLDADDHMMPGTLQTLRAYLKTHPSADAVSGWMHYMTPDGVRFHDVRAPEMHASPRHHGYMVHSGCMFRREFWERVGGYPDHPKADWYLWEAAQAVGARFSVLSQYVIERRIHPESASFAKSPHLQAVWRKAQV